MVSYGHLGPIFDPKPDGKFEEFATETNSNKLPSGNQAWQLVGQPCLKWKFIAGAGEIIYKWGIFQPYLSTGAYRRNGPWYRDGQSNILDTPAWRSMVKAFLSNFWMHPHFAKLDTPKWSPWSMVITFKLVIYPSPSNSWPAGLIIFRRSASGRKLPWGKLLKIESRRYTRLKITLLDTTRTLLDPTETFVSRVSQPDWTSVSWPSYIYEWHPAAAPPRLLQNAHIQLILYLK